MILPNRCSEVQLHFNDIMPDRTKTKSQHKIDVRGLEIAEVCSIGNWLDRYMRLEIGTPLVTSSPMHKDRMVRFSREYEGDLGLFGVD